MSRSFKKTPISGNAIAPSEKKDKETWHRRLRRRVHAALHRTDPDEYIEIDRREVSDPWNMAKDGKRYRINVKEKDMRK